MFKVEPNEVQLFFHIKNNITWPHTANNPIRGTTAIPQKILFISRTDTVLPRRNSMNNAKSIISGTTLTGYENMANISQAANAAFNVLSSEKTNGDTPAGTIQARTFRFPLQYATVHYRDKSRCQLHPEKRIEDDF